MIDDFNEFSDDCGLFGQDSLPSDSQLIEGLQLIGEAGDEEQQEVPEEWSFDQSFNLMGSENGSEFSHHNFELEEQRTAATQPAPESETAKDARDHMVFNALLLDRPTIQLPWDDQRRSPLDDVWKFPSMPALGRMEAFMGQFNLDAHKPETKTPDVTDLKRRRLMATSLARTDDQLFTAALRKLRELVLYKVEDTKLGVALLDVAGRLVPESEIAQSFKDAVAGKAISTVSAGVAAYHRFARWVIDNNFGRPMQLSERLIYRYLHHLEQSGAGATAGTAYLKSVFFLDHHVGFLGEAVKSMMTGRVNGAAKKMLETKEPIKQAKPITVEHVWAMEQHLFSAHIDTKQQCMLGFMLFCLYASARFSDAARLDHVSFEFFEHIIIVEGEAKRYKTANMVKESRRGTAMPFLALGNGLYHMSWADCWLRALKAENLLNGSTIMPALSDITGHWLDRRMTASEGIFWLRELMIDAGVPHTAVWEYSTHSLKATALHWAIQSRIFSMDERRVMGHHVDPGNQMPLTYSRDELCNVLVKLWKVIDMITTGQISPDAPRAQRVAMATAAFTETHSDEESSDDEDRHEPLQELPEPQLELEETRLPFPAERFDECLQHQTSGVLHLILDDETLRCHRPISHNYSKPKFGAARAAQYAFCIQCCKNLP